MAPISLVLSLTPFSTLTRLSHTRITTLSSVAGFSPFSIRCMRTVSTPIGASSIVVDIHPSNFEDSSYIQSLTSAYVGESWKERADKLKKEAKRMLEEMEEPKIKKLELIDTLQRLGLCYHFEVEITRILESIYNKKYGKDDDELSNNNDDLYSTSLQFRLMRQQGYHVPQEVYNKFRDECGNFKQGLCEDVKGLMYLYEASFLSIMGEDILDEAQDFSYKQLKENLDKCKLDSDLAVLVSHSLKLPLHWRMPRLEARWFINVYETRQDMNKTLLELAKLDFNMVQAIHLDDLKHMSRWWKNTGLGDNLSFARDNLMENFYWSVGMVFEPQYQHDRRIITKLASLITILDDIYDNYATLQQLEIFTNAVERWDINGVGQLPCEMKVTFMALHKFVHELYFLAPDQQQDPLVISCLKQVWTDLCKSYLVEAKWQYMKYTPSFEEYINNAWISVGGALVLVNLYYNNNNNNSLTKKEALNCLHKYPTLLRCSSTIVRLSNDLGPSQAEETTSDNCKSIQCYMKESKSSEGEARAYLCELMRKNWKKMNEDLILDSKFDRNFIRSAINLARMSLVMYQNGNGHGMTEMDFIRVMSLIINPIPLE